MRIKQNMTLELLKLFASYMVVFIHILFYGEFGVVINSLARFAVPLFFLISGFFSYKITVQKIKKRIKHIINLIVFAVILYTMFNVAGPIINGNMGEIISYFGLYFDFKTLLNLIIFNVPVSSGHLWYLFAVLYVYLIFLFCEHKKIREKTIFTVAISLLFLQILLGEIFSAFDIVLPIPIVRNFALMGIPFFGLGLFVRKHESKICCISDKISIISIILGIFETIFSRYFFGKNELYIGSLLILFSIVVTFVKHSNINYPRFLYALTDCSTYVYIFHLIVSLVVQKMYKVFHFDYGSSVFLINIHPIIVCAFSTVLAYLIIQINKKLQKRT